MIGIRREHVSTAGLLGLAVAVLLALLAGGFILIRSDDGHRSGSAWEYYRVTSDGLKVYAAVRGCDDVTGANLNETAERVEISVEIDHGLVCGDDLVLDWVAVRLGSPLNERAVYDAACLASRESETGCLRGTYSDSRWSANK